MTTDTTTTDPRAAAEEARMADMIARRRGAVGHVRPPAGPTGDDALDAAIATYRRLFTEHRGARTDLAQLEGQRKQAVQQDRDAWAAALVEGTEKDPGTSATDKADAALLVARRKVDALGAAVDTAANNVSHLLAAHAATVTTHARQTAAAAVTDAAAALEALADAAGRHAAALALERWVTNPAKGYNEQAVPTPLTRTNGSAFTVAELVGALRGAFAG